MEHKYVEGFFGLIILTNINHLNNSLKLVNQDKMLSLDQQVQMGGVGGNTGNKPNKKRKQMNSMK